LDLAPPSLFQGGGGGGRGGGVGDEMRFGGIKKQKRRILKLGEILYFLFIGQKKQLN
jgi:hypothetical protein